jgi:indolepyruvate ferredoxin oxidoreductase
MALWMGRQTSTFTQMGGEGVPWVGQAPFCTDSHVFANLGDGTYFHSGLLAVRQAVAAKVNITYKILFNDAVAMTGGQPVDGTLRVPEMSRELEAEGVREIVIVTDEPERYADRSLRLAPGVTVHHRDQLDVVQRRLREVPGCTALIYEQTCANEKRRRRKRGTLVDPARRVVINELVCEGCGDCSVQSNCLSVEPVETEFGRKRRINQSTCNKDYSCVKGFCPSFVTVEGGTLKKPQKQTRIDPLSLPALPEPVLPALDRAWGIVVAGVGGTGVITIGQLLGMAAHIEGKGVVTQDAGGLAQKGGATWSHIQIAADPAAIYTTKVDLGQADLVIACDAIVAADRQTLAVMAADRTRVAMNNHRTPTAAFVNNPDWQFPGEGCEAAISAVVGSDRLGLFDAERVAVHFLGESIYTNPLMLGYAWQRGWVPVGRDAIARAITLNGVAADNNRAAFEWGRRCANDLGEVMARVQTAAVIAIVRKPGLAEIVERRAEFLLGYQDAAYAARYRAAVERVRDAETALGSSRLSEAVARNLFKLMAYKDEYEVARLHTDPAFTAGIAARFEGDYKLVHHLAPPLLAGRNERGELVKSAFQPWVRSAFKVLAKLKGLRGTALDPFGYSAERRGERELITRYETDIADLLHDLKPQKLALAVEIASVPEDIRGYGHVKARHLVAAEARRAALFERWRGERVDSAAPQTAAA